MPNIQKLPIEELQLGMYVTKIESKKSGVTLKAGGRVSSQVILDKMKAQQIAFVYVDLDRNEVELSIADEAEPEEEEEKVEQKLEQKEEPSAPPNKQDVQPESMDKELDQAKVLFGEAKQLQEKLFESAMQDEAVDIEQVETTTNDIIGSIFRNPDALLFMTRMKERDDYLFEHAINTSILMTAFASYLEYDEKLIQEMAIGAFMFDIGKILIPKSILNKTSKLTDDEFRQVQRHVEYSTKIIEGIPGISPVSIDVAATHHERLDGSGYPEGLKGDEIPTWGRMIAIVDTYDAMTANRKYQGACASVAAFRAMLDSPQHFDNELVQQFIKCVGIYPVGSLVQLKSGRLGMIYESNDDPLKPVVVVFYSVSQRAHTEVKRIDLKKYSGDEIVKSVNAEDLDLSVNRELLESLTLSLRQ